jgi:hypothetical protein
MHLLKQTQIQLQTVLSFLVERCSILFDKHVLQLLFVCSVAALPAGLQTVFSLSFAPEFRHP